MITMFEACVPPCLRALGTLDMLLDKGAAHCEATGIAPSVLLDARLFPDMLPFTSQIRIASDAAKLASFRLAGLDAPKQPDNETSFGELKDRVAMVSGLLATLTPGQFENSRDRNITVPTRTEALQFKGLDYLQCFALPNMYFHVATAYGLLRHNGVVLGKRDYLGPMPA